MIGFREVTLDQLAVDHQLEVDTLTGTARLSVPIRISPGRDGFGPALALGYSSGGRNSIFGVGWFLSGVPSIGLDTSRALPTYSGDADAYVFGEGHPLVPALREHAGAWIPVVEDRGAFRVQHYRSKTERSFERFERWMHQATRRVHWIVFARNGVVSVFGRAADDSTRIADPRAPGRRTFQWLLEAQYHPKGSAIIYEYKPEDGAGIDASASFESRRLRGGAGFAQRYLKRIRYGNSRPLSLAQPVDTANEWHFEVVYDYGEHPGLVPTPSDARPAPRWAVRSDAFSTHRPGFELRSYRLCRRVLVFHRFPELAGGAPCVVGATELTHRDDPAGAVLASITYRGYRRNADGSTSHRAVPPLELAYSEASAGTAFEPAAAADNLPSGLDGALYQWVDLRNEGLPGVLCRHDGTWYFKENLGDGRFGATRVVDEVPAAISAAFQLQDFDGDGNMNLVGFEGREAGYYQRDRDRGRWEGFRAFRDLPRIDLANARVQWVDLNGDGHADLIVERSDGLVWYPSVGADGFGPAVELARRDVRAGGAPTLAQSAELHTFFADMTGDGLLDMVRVDSGRVEYWANLGHGEFGPGVVMEGAPLLDDFGELDARRLRLVDLDGSGTADLLYIGRGEIQFWINQSGNRFGPAHRLAKLPYIDRLASAQVFDFLGDGTRCLVWSTPLPSHEGQALQYLRLTIDLPPRLLRSVSNGIGREARLSYRSSAREYLRDKHGERPWRCLLPHHVMVVGGLEGIDRIGGGRLVTRYEYRDGYFDDSERRFVGFGLVDAFDADQVVAGDSGPAEEVTPPSVVRNWYHVGASGAFAARAAEFYDGDPGAARPPAPELADIARFTTEEQLGGHRALSGVLWRQEFYALAPDGGRELHPFRTTEFAYRVRRLQPATDERAAAYAIEQSESLSHEYERDPRDPRVTHDVMLESDPFGSVTARASIAYPRRAGPDVRPEQQVLHAELVQRTHRNVEERARFEVGIETEERRHALTGLAPAGRVFGRTELATQVAAALASPLEFHAPPAGGGPHARLVGLRRTRFWDDTRAELADAGQVGAVTLLHHVERAVLPEAAVEQLFDGRADAAMLAADGHYRREDGFWWADETIYHYRDSAGFFRLREEISPGGGRQTYAFDAHYLLVTSVADSLGNRVASTPDYQILASDRIEDANDNISEVLYDPLGVAFVTTLRGEQLGVDGAPHSVGDDRVATYEPVAGTTAADVLADPGGFLQGATRCLFYDLDAFRSGDGPPRSIHLERERHLHDGEGGSQGTGPIRVTIRYLDGFGRAIQTKLGAGPGPAIQRVAGAVVVDGRGRPVLADSTDRWLTSGHDVYNNKGWLVRKYEPLFSTSPAFEPDRALREYGVTARTHYDPVGRIVRHDLADGTFTTSAYASWSTRQADANDNVVGSAYETARQNLQADDVERRALDKARAHAGTPTVVELDPLGRPFRVREVAAADAERVSTTVYGVLGLPDRIIDPRELTAFAYRYDMLGRTVREESVDAGRRCKLLDAGGRPAHQWDARGVHTRYSYDEHGRHVGTRIDGAVDPDGTVLDNLVERVTYGDAPEVPQAKLKNARGRAVRRLDDAGIVAVERYHMDGQLLDVRRSLRTDYRSTVDWTDPTALHVAGLEHRSQARLDALGRTVWESLPDGTTREYAYARTGHVAEVRLTTADAALDRQVIASSIEANPRGQRTRLVLGNGVETTYAYDAATFRLAGLRTRRAVGAARDYLDLAYTYDPAGNITHWIDRVQDPGATAPLLQGLTASAACEFTYDPLYQLTEATGRVHQALLQHDYRSGLEGENPIKGTRHLSLNNGAAVERYTRTYDYDVAGNLRRMHHEGGSRSWTTELWTSPTSNRSLPAKDPNGIDVVDPESGFDANGNTVGLPHLRSLSWNHANRLARAVVIDRTDTGQPDDAEYYVYGADGLRVRRITERVIAGELEVTETTYFEGCEIKRITRGSNTRLLRHTSHITDGANRLATLHQWSIDGGALETDDIGRKRLHYLVGNHLGSVALELDEAGDVISYEEYFPFGGTSFLAGSSARDVKLKEYRYSGKCRDDATGFYCYEYRYYAPFIGNWLSPDPLGPVDGLNLYRFVRNNPIRFVDVDGLQTYEWHGDYEGLSPQNRRRYETESESSRRFVERFIENRIWTIDGAAYRVDVDVRAVRDDQGNFIRWAGYEAGPRVGILEDVFGPEAIAALESLGDLDSGEGFGAGSETGTEPRDGDGQAQGGDGDGQGTNPADGSSGTASTQQGQTGESGSNGSATAGQGLGAGQQGRGPSGTGAGTGTGTGAGTASGGGGDAQGRAGGRGTSGSGAGQSSGTARDGTAGMPPVPSGAPPGHDSVQHSPDLGMPEVAPEAGTPVTEPSGGGSVTGSGDTRAEPGSEAGSATRPSGTEGRGAEGAEGGWGDDGQSGGGRGPRGGVGDHEIPSSPAWIDTGLDWLQTGLDVIGLIPGLGEIADGVNGLISLARGDYAGAALSFAAMIPFAGWAATAGKFGRRAVQATETVADVTNAVTRHGDEAASVLGTATARRADGDLLPDDAVVHRIGGGQVENLVLKTREEALDPPGFSVLEGGTPQSARQQMIDAFPNATGLHRRAETVGTATVRSIREAGFDVIHNPTRNFPNHGRVVHPDGLEGFTAEAVERLSRVFTNMFLGG